LGYFRTNHGTFLTVGILVHNIVIHVVGGCEVEGVDGFNVGGRGCGGCFGNDWTNAGVWKPSLAVGIGEFLSNGQLSLGVLHPVLFREGVIEIVLHGRNVGGAFPWFVFNLVHANVKGRPFGKETGIPARIFGRLQSSRSDLGFL
jgi:hypothetical protein